MNAEFARLAATHPRLAALVTRALGRVAPAAAVVFPNDEVSLQAVMSCASLGLARQTLYGNAAVINKLCPNIEATDSIAIVDTGDAPRHAADAAVSATRRGLHALLVKGALHTDELLSAVLNRETGLRGGGRLTHTFLFEMQRYHKLLGLTDAVVNIEPDLKTKAEALLHAVRLLRQLGVVAPKVAALAAVEVETASIGATQDAAQLAAQGRAGVFGDAQVEGPLGLDNAISASAARIKGIVSSVAGDPDLLVVPDLNAGNLLYKSFVYLAGAECAGVVHGAQVPIVLTSRAESVFSRLASMAVASMLHQGNPA